jgi:hypothetical protein
VALGIVYEPRLFIDNESPKLSASKTSVGFDGTNCISRPDVPTKYFCWVLPNSVHPDKDIMNNIRIGLIIVSGLIIVLILNILVLL